MTAPISSANSRFRLETFDHNDNFVASIPYMNIQCEAHLNEEGHTFRCNIPYRGYPQVTQANLLPGKHEIGLYDMLTDYYLFKGPIWDATASSDQGLLSISAQDPLSYLAKAELRSQKVYSSVKPEAAMADLITYWTSVSFSTLTSLTLANGTKNISVVYNAADFNKISDLLSALSNLGDGVEYFVDSTSGNHVLTLYGGLIKPAQATLFALEYGGNMPNYSLQLNAQSIANDYSLQGANGISSNASDVTAQTDYNAKYRDSGRSDLLTTGSLSDAANKYLKANKYTKQIPTLTTRTLLPWWDFTFGDQVHAFIKDGWVQYDGLVRVVGWQLTIGANDDFTTNIYSNDLLAVT